MNRTSLSPRNSFTPKHVKALLMAACAVGMAASSAHAAETYNWTNFGGGSFDWNDNTHWLDTGTPNAAGYPGGDAAAVDDIAIFQPGASIGGAVTLNYTGMNAASLQTLTIALNGTATGDNVTFNVNGPMVVNGTTSFLSGVTSTATLGGRVTTNVNSNLTIAGALITTTGSTLNINNGGNIAVTGAYSTSSGNASTTAGLLIAAGGTASFGGITANSNGFFNMTVNGALVTSALNSASGQTGFQCYIDTVNNVSLGNVNLSRTLGGNANTTNGAANAGLHIWRGVVTANDLKDGSNNSSAGAEVSGGTLTVGGANFWVGYNTGGRLSAFFVNAQSSNGGTTGTLIGTNAAGMIVGQSSAPNTSGGNGIFIVQAGSATLEKLTLAGVQATTATTTNTNRGSLTLSGGTLTLGSGGLVATSAGFVSGVSLGSAYGVTLSGGTLAAKANWSSNADMTLSNVVTMQAGDGSNGYNITLGGNLSGTGNLVKTGAGKLLLSGNSNAFSGATTVSAGTLLYSLAAPASTVNVASGATFGGSGTFNGSVTVQSGGHLSPGIAGVTNGAGSMIFSGTTGVTLNSGAILDLDFSLSPVLNDQVTLSGGTLTTGGPISVNIFEGGTTNTFINGGTYTLFNLSSVSAFQGNISDFQLANLGTNNASNYAILLTGTGANTKIVLTVQGALSGAFWNNSTTNGDWGTAGNWVGNAVPGGQGAAITFGGQAAAAGVVNLNGVRTAGAISLDNVNAYTLNAGTGGALVLDNGTAQASIVVVSGSHTIAAPIELTSDTGITIGSGTSVLTISGVISNSTNAAAGLSVLGSGKVVLAADNTYTGTTTVAAGATLQIGNGGTVGSVASTSIVANGTVLINRSDALSVAGNQFTGSGSVTMAGTGTMTLSDNATFAGTIGVRSGKLLFSGPTSLAGTVRVEGGVAQLASGATLGSAALRVDGGVFDVNGNNVPINGLSGSGGSIDNVSAGGTSLITVTTGANSTYSGAILNTTGITSLTKEGSGRLTLGGANSYAGDTIINNGAIRATSSAAFGTGTVRIVATNGLILGDGVNIANNISDNTSGSGAEFMDMIDANATATLSGNLGMASGQYRISTSAANATVVVTGTHSTGSGFAIIDKGNVVYAGNGALTNTGTNGIIAARAGSATLTLKNNALVSGTKFWAGGGQTAANSFTFTIQDQAQLLLSGGANTFELLDMGSNANTTATYNFSGGTITTQNFLKTRNNPVTVNFNGTTFASISDESFFFQNFTGLTANLQAGGAKFNTTNGSVNVDVPMVHDASLVTADGGVSQTGTGTVTLNGASNYNGVTSINGGTVRFASNPHTIGAIRGDTVQIGNTVVSQANSGTSKVNSLLIDGSAGNWSGKLDITNNVLAVQSVDATAKAAAKATLVDQITSGKNGGAWNGNGVTSSSIASNPNATLALADNADLGWTSSGGQTLDANSLVVTRAIIGDINLDGNVDLADYDKWYKNVGTGTAYSYAAGDVNMDGNIDLADYDLWYKHVGAAPLTLASQPALGGGVSAVPEPASLAVLALGSAALLGSRRRRK